MGKHLRVADYKVMPWKNGLGTTTELAVAQHPTLREDSPFLWRISIAGVTEDGPFSHFPNIDRHIMIIAGNGLVLEANGHGTYILDKPYVVTQFSGDWDVKGKLFNGPITDLNVMVDRRFAKAHVEVLGVNANGRTFDHKTSITFIHVLENTPAISILMNEQEIHIDSGESYMLSGEPQRVVVKSSSSASGDSHVVVASIDVIVL